ncbi:hypothetical protein TGAMA5MH_00278 [Trichoderma gamsii]|uniref:Uncharacterized protein n=1 Tax=Trichoderma gamsii TaxID=398673 RepID=A0A2K0TSS6_9HYPO|nr:hypothetical protein TGAMA5MH_00278 [Trichoderma gamsii]
MRRVRYKRKCVGAGTSRAPKRNRADARIPPIVDAVQEINDNEAQGEVVGEKNEPVRAEEARAVCEALIKQTFDKIGMDVDSYRACFNACVEKAIGTGMAYAASWSRWGGYKNFNFKMTCVAVLCKTTGKLHCPTAPTIVVAYTLLRIRKVPIQEDALAYNLMEICKTLDHESAKAAIRCYEDHPDVILMLQDAFEQPNIWPPMARNRKKEQGQIANVAVATRFDSEQPHHGQFLLNSTGSEAPDATPEGIQTYKVQVPRTITREEAEQALQSIIEPLKKLEIPESSLLRHLTLPRLKVLSVHDKTLVLLWMNNTNPELFSEWKKETQQDLEQYRWTETVERTLPETQTSDAAETAFKRMEERAKTGPDSSSLDDLALLKKIFEHQERRGIDPAFYQKTSQWMSRIEHRVGEQAAASAKVLKMIDKLDLVDEQVTQQAATSAKVLKRLGLVLAKLNETPEPMTEDAESCHPGDSLMDTAINDSFWDGE